MASLEIHPLSELRDEAAQLLSERFAHQRAAEPLLPEIGDFAVHVPDEEGLVSTRSGQAVAYLAGEVKRAIATVGFALAQHVLEGAHEHGFRSVTTDWRSANHLSSRFWPRRGFRPQYLRLYRAIP